MKITFILFSLLTSASMLLGQPVGDSSLVRKKLDVVRLPDMNLPRAGHTVFYADGELTVVGGHTSGFVMTPTAEYFSGDTWHLIPTIYHHDDGMAVVLDSGRRVLLAGGHDKNLGIGQSWEVEMYDPKSHSSKGFSCLDHSRALSQGVEMDSGRVLIVGNHRGNDGFEMFDGRSFFHYVKDVDSLRFVPYVFPLANDDAIAFGAVWWDGDFRPYDIVDRLKGEPFSVPLLKEWMPMSYDQNNHAHESFVGDKTVGDYSYLIASRKLDGEVAFIFVQDTVFSLLATTCPVPTTSQWGRIKYDRTAIADRSARRAYLVGNDTTGRIYVVAVEYDKQPAPITLFYTDPLPDFGNTTPVLTPEGDLIVTGGIIDDNFAPFASVWLLQTGERKKVAKAETHPNGFWLWGLCGLLLLGIIVMIVRYYVRQPQCDNPATIPQCDNSTNLASPQCDNAADELMARITQLMETQHLYLNPEMKIGDVANALGVHRNAVSASINAQGCTFSQLVNNYRLQHAKKLLREATDMKIAAIGLESGFANESTFFRAFKAATGMTPKEWVAQQQAVS